MEVFYFNLNEPDLKQYDSYVLCCIDRFRYFLLNSCHVLFDKVNFIICNFISFNEQTTAFYSALESL